MMAVISERLWQNAHSGKKWESGGTYFSGNFSLYFFLLLEDSTDVFLKMMSYTLKYELCVDS